MHYKSKSSEGSFLDFILNPKFDKEKDLVDSFDIKDNEYWVVNGKFNIEGTPIEHDGEICLTNTDDSIIITQSSII